MNDTGQQVTQKPAKYMPELNMNAVHLTVPQARTPRTTRLWEDKSWGRHSSLSPERDPQAEELHQQGVSPSPMGGGDNPPKASPGTGDRPGRQAEQHPSLCAEALHQQGVCPSPRGGRDNPPTASPGTDDHSGTDDRPGRQKEDHPQAECVKPGEKNQREQVTSSPAAPVTHDQPPLIPAPHHGWPVQADRHLPDEQSVAAADQDPLQHQDPPLPLQDEHYHPPQCQGEQCQGHNHDQEEEHNQPDSHDKKRKYACQVCKKDGMQWETKPLDLDTAMYMLMLHLGIAHNRADCLQEAASIKKSILPVSPTNQHTSVAIPIESEPSSMTISSSICQRYINTAYYKSVREYSGVMEQADFITQLPTTMEEIISTFPNLYPSNKEEENIRHILPNAYPSTKDEDNFRNNLPSIWPKQVIPPLKLMCPVRCGWESTKRVFWKAKTA
jgi:hypothetical protein